MTKYFLMSTFWNEPLIKCNFDYFTIPLDNNFSLVLMNINDINNCAQHGFLWSNFDAFFDAFKDSNDFNNLFEFIQNKVNSGIIEKRGDGYRIIIELSETEEMYLKLMKD